MIREVGNIELCELLDVEPKAQCRVCLSYWDVGIVYCTCGHFLRIRPEENKRFVQYTMDLLSIPNYYIKKGRPTGTVTGRSQGIPSTTSGTRSRRNARRNISWVFTTGSSAIRSSARICMTSAAMKKFAVRWTNWRTKTTRTKSLKMKFVNTFPPIQQNSMKNGYDDNNGYDESYETKCATNYSIITNNNWNNTHNKQLTMHNKYTNDDVHTDDCVVHIMR